MLTTYKGFLFVIIAAIGYGLTPVFGKMAFDVNVSTETLLFVRFTIAFFVLVLYCFFSNTNLHISRSQFYVFVLLGILYCLQTTLYFNAIKHISASLAVMLLYLYPVFVLILSLVFEKKSLSIGIIFSMLLSLLGIGTLLGFPSTKVDFYGVILAVGSALAYAVYIMISKRLLTGLTPIVTTTGVIFFTAVAFLISGCITQKLNFSFPAQGWYAGVSLALFSTVLSFWAFFTGMKYIGSTRASIVSTFEPIVTTISAVLFLNETINFIKILGMVMVLSSVVLLILSSFAPRIPPSSISGG